MAEKSSPNIDPKFDEDPVISFFYNEVERFLYVIKIFVAFFERLLLQLMLVLTF